MLPLLGLVFVNRPEDVGQQIDGGREDEIPVTEQSGNAVHSFTVREARKTAAYWIMLGNNALWALIVTAVFFNLLSIFSSLGITAEVAATTYTVFAGAALITQLVLGPWANRGPLQVMFALCMTALGLGIAVLSIATQPLLAYLYAMIVGISAGLISLVGGTLLPRYYGREHLGNIRGGVLTAQVAGSSLGPFITGVIYDATGNFQISLWIFIAILIPAALISLRAVQPPEPIQLEPGT